MDDRCPPKFGIQPKISLRVWTWQSVNNTIYKCLDFHHNMILITQRYGISSFRPCVLKHVSQIDDFQSKYLEHRHFSHNFNRKIAAELSSQLATGGASL
jgi:hypothetical protein